MIIFNLSRAVRWHFSTFRRQLSRRDAGGV
jgi:hypothetical protein